MLDSDDQSESREPNTGPPPDSAPRLGNHDSPADSGQRQFTRPGERALAALKATRTAQERQELSAEETFAANLKTLRASMGLSQESLAEQMSERGFRWHQATVYKIENGARQVQLGEAKAIATILSVPLDRLTEDPDSIQTVSNIRAYMIELEKHDEALWDAGRTYENMREALEREFYELPDGVRNMFSEREIESIHDRTHTYATQIINDDDRWAPF